MSFIQRFVRRPQQTAVRRLNFVIHLWAGILLTLYLIVIGVTGSMLVFRSELEFLSGSKPGRNIRASEPFADVAVVVDRLKQAYPNWPIVSVQTPTGSESTFLAVLEGRRRIKVACHPSTGEILGEVPPSPEWLNFVTRLHETLLLGRAGRRLNGIGAVFLLLLNATGMVIWWPGIRTWRRALQVDIQRHWRRVNFDLHSAAGFWTVAIVSFWAISGIYFAWPRESFRAVNSISRVISARPPVISVQPEPDGGALDIHTMVDHARALDPGTKFGGILFPYGRRAPLAVLMHRRDSPGREYDDTIYFNPYSGAYVATWRYGVNQTLGDWLIWAQIPLHFGTYWGLGIKVIWAVSGLAIPLLGVTGLLMYWNRALRKKWKKLGKNKASAETALTSAS